MIDLATLEHEDLHPAFHGVQPDTWDPAVDRDQGDAGSIDPRLYLRLEGFEPMTFEPVEGEAVPRALGAHPNPSGLSDEHRVKARDLTVQAALLGYRMRDSIHYSQNAELRWGGVRGNLKAYEGNFARYYDCSSFGTWCVGTNGLRHYDRPGHVKADTVNGLRWKAGYTGTILMHGVAATRTLQRGDLIVYGFGWPGEHTAVYVGGGMCVSHGSERGPLYVSYNYRRDVMAVRRSI